MKNVLLAALAALPLLTACGEDDKEDNPSPTPASGPFVAKIDGTQLTGDAAKSMAKFQTTTKTLQIIGQTSDQKETVVLTMLGMGTGFTEFKPGTYDFDPAHISRLEYFASASYSKYQDSGYQTWSTHWEEVKTGKIVLESVTSTHVKGTFFFDAVKQNNNGTFDASSIKKVTEGSFDLDIKRL